MIDDDRLRQLLRSALPPPTGSSPSGDLWPRVLRRIETSPGWSWLDMSLAAMVAVTLLMFPEGLFLLAYHL
jgi:hypothetical protein